MNLKQIGFILVVVAIAAVVISQTYEFRTTSYSTDFFGMRFENIKEDTDTKNLFLYGGIILFVLGGSLLGADLFKNTSVNSSNINVINEKSHDIIYSNIETISASNIKCSNCGKANQPNLIGNFCAECGVKLTNNQKIDKEKHKLELGRLNDEMNLAYSKLIEIQNFHLGRNQFEKEHAIIKQVAIIKTLKQEISRYI